MERVGIYIVGGLIKNYYAGNEFTHKNGLDPFKGKNAKKVRW